MKVAATKVHHGAGEASESAGDQLLPQIPQYSDIICDEFAFESSGKAATVCTCVCPLNSTHPESCLLSQELRGARACPSPMLIMNF